MATVEQIVKIRIIPTGIAPSLFGGGCELSMSMAEARRVTSELLDITAAPLLECEPSYCGIKLSDSAWDVLEQNIRNAKRKKQTKKPKKPKPKQEPVVAPKRKK